MSLRIRLACLAVAVLAAAAQVLALAQSSPSRPVPPPAKSEPHAAFLAAPDAVPPSVLALSPIDPAEIAAAKAANSRTQRKALQIGVGRATFGLREAGSAALAWRVIDGGLVGRWEVSSAGAAALRVEISARGMPEGFALRFAGDAEPAMVYGPFTLADFDAASATLWSPVLMGERAAVEVFVPHAIAPSVEGLAITHVSHLFVSPVAGDVRSLAKTGESGSCEVDLVCKSASSTALANAGKAVARMVFTVGASSYLCTGTLLNPTDASNAPYFYSATHCIDSQAVANTLVTFWFYDRTACGSGSTSPAMVSRTGGATLLYTDAGSDVLLLRLTNAPPAGAWFAGWDAATLASGTAITGIHHPRGDWKKVSLATMESFQNGLGTGNPSGSFIVSRWTEGVTEGGSSGSAIFTAVGSPATDYRLRGGLWGGASQCGAAPSDMYDYYSRLDQAYPSIRQWIDPPISGPALTVSVGSIEFGAQSMATTSLARAVVLTNVGSSSVTIATIATDIAQFAQSSACGVLATGARCTVSVTFTPRVQAGPFDSTAIVSGVLLISSDATPSPLTVTLRGTAEKSLVSHYYQSILRRVPDFPGKVYWSSDAQRVAALGANVNEAWYALAAASYGSTEYAAFNRSDAEYVTDLYNTFFNRAPDAPGLAYWNQQLFNGLPRGVALAGFMFSPEFTSFALSIFGNTAVRPEIDTVMDFYRGLLARLPDSGGFAYWLQRFRTAQCQGSAAVLAEVEAISAAFANGSEYAARARTNAEFVGDAYNALLRRGGDIVGVQYWQNQLLVGARTRNGVRQEFVASPEFTARVNAIIAAGCLP